MESEGFQIIGSKEYENKDSPANLVGESFSLCSIRLCNIFILLMQRRFFVYHLHLTL